MALNELRQALEVGVGGVGVEAGVELAARRWRPPPARRRPAGAASATLAKRPERDAEERGHDAGHEEGEPEHAQRVVEVGEVEHLEVGGVDRGDGHADDDLGRALRSCGRSASPRCPPSTALRSSAGMDDGVDRQGRGVDLATVVEHRVGVGPGVDADASRSTYCVSPDCERAAHEDGVGEGLVLRRRLAPGQQEVAGVK